MLRQPRACEDDSESSSDRTATSDAGTVQKTPSKPGALSPETILSTAGRRRVDTTEMRDTAGRHMAKAQLHACDASLTVETGCSAHQDKEEDEHVIYENDESDGVVGVVMRTGSHSCLDDSMHEDQDAKAKTHPFYSKDCEAQDLRGGNTTLAHGSRSATSRSADVRQNDKNKKTPQPSQHSNPSLGEELRVVEGSDASDASSRKLSSLAKDDDAHMTDSADFRERVAMDHDGGLKKRMRRMDDTNCSDDEVSCQARGSPLRCVRRRPDPDHKDDLEPEEYPISEQHEGSEAGSGHPSPSALYKKRRKTEIQDVKGHSVAQAEEADEMHEMQGHSHDVTQRLGSSKSKEAQELKTTVQHDDDNDDHHHGDGDQDDDLHEARKCHQDDDGAGAGGEGSSVAAPSSTGNPDDSHEPCSTLYVRNLPPHIRTEQVKEHFSRFGEVLDCRIIMNPVTKDSRGFGFVSFASAEVADLAMTKTAECKLDGKVLRVEKARRNRPHDPTPGEYKGPTGASIKYDNSGRLKPGYVPYWHLPYPKSGGGNAGAGGGIGPSSHYPPHHHQQYSSSGGHYRSHSRGRNYHPSSSSSRFPSPSSPSHHHHHYGAGVGGSGGPPSRGTVGGGYNGGYGRGGSSGHGPTGGGSSAALSSSHHYPSGGPSSHHYPGSSSYPPGGMPHHTAYRGSSGGGNYRGRDYYTSSSSRYGGGAPLSGPHRHHYDVDGVPPGSPSGGSRGSHYTSIHHNPAPTTRGPHASYSSSYGRVHSSSSYYRGRSYSPSPPPSGASSHRHHVPSREEASPGYGYSGSGGGSGVNHRAPSASGHHHVGSAISSSYGGPSHSPSSNYYNTTAPSSRGFPSSNHRPPLSSSSHHDGSPRLRGTPGASSGDGGAGPLPPPLHQRHYQHASVGSSSEPDDIPPREGGRSGGHPGMSSRYPGSQGGPSHPSHHFSHAHTRDPSGGYNSYGTESEGRSNNNRRGQPYREDMKPHREPTGNRSAHMPSRV